MTPTWFEHAAFWSGVRRATVAPRSHIDKRVKKIGSTEIWTRIAGFKVQSANHYTIEPRLVCWIDFLGQDISCLMLWNNLRFQCLYHFAYICLPIFTGKKIFCLFPAGFEPATLCVWSTRDNHYTKETVCWNRPKKVWWSLNSNIWAKRFVIPSGDRTQDLWIRSPTRYPLR